MSKNTTLVRPEPEEPMSWEEQVAQYRKAHRHNLKRVATVMTLPLHKMKSVLAAAANKQHS